VAKCAYFGPWADPDAALARYEGRKVASTKIPSNARPAKPSKPHPDYPLYAHTRGQWAKRVRNRVHYFGAWAAPDAALAKWLKEKDDLLAGREPSNVEGLTVLQLTNHFLTSKKRLVNSGELTPRTLHDYERNCAKVMEALRPSRVVATLRPADFEKLRAKLAESVHRLSRCHFGQNGHVAKPLMRPESVVVGEPRRENVSQVAFAEDDEMIQDFVKKSVAQIVLMCRWMNSCHVPRPRFGPGSKPFSSRTRAMLLEFAQDPAVSPAGSLGHVDDELTDLFWLPGRAGSSPVSRTFDAVRCNAMRIDDPEYLTMKVYGRIARAILHPAFGAFPFTPQHVRCLCVRGRC
jgi:hypothetical protein